MRKTLDELKLEFIKKDASRNNMLNTIAWACRRDGQELEQARRTMYDLYDAYDIGQGRNVQDMDTHHKEVDRSVEGVYEVELGEIKTEIRHMQESKTDYTAERETWHDENACPTELLKQVKEQDVREDRITTAKALEALFRNANGHVWHGATEGIIAEKSWTDTCNVKSIPAGEKYVCTATFGNILKTGEEGVVYERTNENVQQVAFAVLEMDAPMAGRKYTKEELNTLPEEERKAYRGHILEDTCLIIENIGVKPTTITFSGNKSYHCAFRFSKPVDVQSWNSRYNELKSAYQRIGADEAMLSLMRCTRMPLGTTKIKAEDDEGQRLMYFNPDAEVGFDEFVERLTGLASRISEVKMEKDLHLPMFKDAKGWHKNCEKRTDFITEARVSKVETGDTQRLIVSDERGVFRYKTPQQIADYLVGYVFRNASKKEGEHFAELYKSELSKNSLDYFVAIVRPLNKPVDTFDTVCVPFKNGMLVIGKTEAVLKTDNFMGCDISHTCPTLYRDFAEDREKGEFELFLEHACGSEEDHEFWKGRKKSIKTLIGYMVCRQKESINYINLLTEETEEEDSGRTGKGIIATAVKYWRKRCLVDMKQVFGDDTKRWIYTSLDRDTDDFIQFDDVRSNIDWEQFYIKAVDDWEIEKKGENKIHIPKADAPKMLFTSNFFPKANGGSQEGRMRIFEISNHYSSKHTPEDEFGHRLFDDWDDDEWHRFDTFVADCVGSYLRNGYVPCPTANMEAKEYEVTVKNKYVKLWFADREDGLFSDLTKKHRLEDFGDEFKAWYKKKYGSDYDRIYSNPYLPTDKKLVGWIKLYCDSNGLGYDKKQETAGDRRRYWKFFNDKDEQTNTSKPPVSTNQLSTNSFEQNASATSVRVQTPNPQGVSGGTNRNSDSFPFSNIEEEEEIYIYKKGENCSVIRAEASQGTGNQDIISHLGAFAPPVRTVQTVVDGEKDPMCESRRIWHERKVAELRAKGMTDIVEEDGRVEFTDPKGKRMEWVHGDTASFPVGL